MSKGTRLKNRASEAVSATSPKDAARTDAFNVQRAKPLPREFFDRHPSEVARELLGKLLIRRHGERILAGRVIETEAYLGQDDPAAHSAAGMTPRNRVLFGPPGYAYVYLIYGNHYCLNVSCLPPGDAGCVLFRALEPVVGLGDMARFRHVELPPDPRPTQMRMLASGPGRLAHALGITRLRDNGKDLTSDFASDLWLADDGFTTQQIGQSPRVGITKAIEHHLRFFVAGSPLVSGKRT